MEEIKPLKSGDYSVEVLAACPVCGSSSKRRWRTGADHLHEVANESFSFERCAECGLCFQNPRPPESEIGRFYFGNYFPHHGKLNPLWLETPIPKTVPLLIRQLRSYHERFGGGTFLDYGCGSTMFLDLMKHYGWKTIGADFASASVAACIEAGHRGYLIKKTEDLDQIEDNSIQVAVLNHVFEHLYHPQEFLEWIHRKLVKGGLLHIAVPNPGGISAKLLRNFWLALEPRHIMLYTPETMSTVVKQAGFTIENIHQEPVTKDMVRSMTYMGRYLGVQAGKGGNYRSQRLEKLLRGPCSLATKLGYGDRFHLVGKK